MAAEIEIAKHVGRVVAVVWLDAYTLDAGWVSEDDVVPCRKTMEHVTVGKLVSANEDGLTLVQSWNLNDDSSQLGNPWTIPVGMVQCISILEVS